MNELRRKRLGEALAKADDALAIIQACLDEEQEAFDNLSENLQQSERGQAMEEAIAALEEAINYAEGVGEKIAEAVG